MSLIFCDSCQNQIEDERAYYSINLHKEIQSKGKIDVLYIDPGLICCEQCATEQFLNPIEMPVRWKTLLKEMLFEKAEPNYFSSNKEE